MKTKTSYRQAERLNGRSRVRVGSWHHWISNSIPALSLDLAPSRTSNKCSNVAFRPFGARLGFIFGEIHVCCDCCDVRDNDAPHLSWSCVELMNVSINSVSNLFPNQDVVLFRLNRDWIRPVFLLFRSLFVVRWKTMRCKNLNGIVYVSFYFDGQ